MFNSLGIFLQRFFSNILSPHYAERIQAVEKAFFYISIRYYDFVSKGSLSAGNSLSLPAFLKEEHGFAHAYYIFQVKHLGRYKSRS